jgi:hypothetical protein
MNGFMHTTKEERIRHIKASLARVYYPEPLELPEWMKEEIRTLKKDADDQRSAP